MILLNKWFAINSAELNRKPIVLLKILQHSFNSDKQSLIHKYVILDLCCDKQLILDIINNCSLL